MKFDINNYKGKYVMHCKTEEEARNFCNYLHSIGRRWSGGSSYADRTNYAVYGSNTAYNFNNDSYAHTNWYTGYTILEWSDFMNNAFTKADLKTGDVILRRDGNVEIVIKELDVLVKLKEYNKLEYVNEDLTHSFLKEADIVAVRRPKIPADCQFSAFKENRGTLVYERKEVEEMTLEEVCKVLGKEIKIVKG
jgi:hypothetical protein